MTPAAFRRRILSWYRAHGRHDLPWRRTHDPYRILISEVMLQQTQVLRVLAKYPEFLKAFPTISSLANAPLARVLAVWHGMGYNRRAGYLQRLARIIVSRHGGRIPRDPALLERLPGVGPSTAGAIAAFAFNRRAVFLETNIRRVYLHFFFSDRRRVGDREVLAKIAATLPSRNFRNWYYALMDYGALALKQIENPNRKSSRYRKQPAFRGSRRELRGRILAEVLSKGTLPTSELKRRLELRCAPRLGPRALEEAINDMQRDSLIAVSAGRVRLPG